MLPKFVYRIFVFIFLCVCICIYIHTYTHMHACLGKVATHKKVVLTILALLTPTANFLTLNTSCG